MSAELKIPAPPQLTLLEVEGEGEKAVDENKILSRKLEADKDNLIILIKNWLTKDPSKTKSLLWWVAEEVNPDCFLPGLTQNERERWQSFIQKKPDQFDPTKTRIHLNQELTRLLISPKLIEKDHLFEQLCALDSGMIENLLLRDNHPYIDLIHLLPDESLSPVLGKMSGEKLREILHKAEENPFNFNDELRFKTLEELLIQAIKELKKPPFIQKIQESVESMPLSRAWDVIETLISQGYREEAKICYEKIPPLDLVAKMNQSTLKSIFSAIAPEEKVAIISCFDAADQQMVLNKLVGSEGQAFEMMKMDLNSFQEQNKNFSKEKYLKTLFLEIQKTKDKNSDLREELKSLIQLKVQL